MFDFLLDNLGTIVVLLVVAAVVVAIIFSRFKAKKNGKSSCGCGCESCAMSGKCHPELNK